MGAGPKTLSRSGWRDSPFSTGPAAGRLGVGGVDQDAFIVEVLNQEALNFEVLNHERSAVSSRGRRSDCHSKKTPPARNTKSASHTPAAGETRPCRAKDTPIKEIEARKS